jgi:transposase-like protein
METLRGEKPIAQICRERAMTDSLVYKWRQEFLEKAPGLFETKQAAASIHADQAERIAELERLVGQLTMENALLKRAAAGWKQPGGETGHDPEFSSRCTGHNAMCGLRLSAQHVLL